MTVRDTDFAPTPARRHAHDGVLVVGAGPVGLCTALGLARRGVPVTVVEREVDVYRAPRAMGYHFSALYGLDDLGLLDEMLERGFPVQGVGMTVRATGEQLRFSTEPLEGRVAHPFSLTLGQDVFAEVVVKHLLEHDHAEILWHTAVTDVRQDAERVHATLDSGEVVSAHYLVASDGGTSRIRTELGLGWVGITWPHNFLATNVRYDFTRMGLLDNNYYIDPVYGAVIARVTKDGLWRATFAEDAALPEEGVEERIVDWLTGLVGDRSAFELVNFSRYRMHQRAAGSMRAGRVVLAGDSAHATNPTSGFGLVGGLYDSYVLSEALAAILDGEVTDDVLDTYSDDRLTAFWTVSSPISTESKRLVFHSDDPDRLEIDLQQMRRVTSRPDLLRGFWLSGARCETPSVVTGRYQSAGRNSPG